MTKRTDSERPSTLHHPAAHPADIARSDSDGEDDNKTLTDGGRASVDIAEDVLADDYEDTGAEKSSGPATRQNFLARFIPTQFRRKTEDYGYNSMPVHQRRPRGRPSRRHRERRRRQGEVEGEMLYEMEEGGEASQTPSRNISPSAESYSQSDSDEDEEKEGLVNGTGRRKAKRSRVASSRFTRVAIHLGIIAFFLALLYAAFKATALSKKAPEPAPKTQPLKWNGTDWWAPTTLLISLDGFRADFLTRDLTPTLNGFIKEGVSPLYMLPPFPSVTFVSHYSMSTGMYAEDHGIVGNTFWDPELKEEFYYTHTENSMQPKWWGGEPFWVTSQRQGVKTAVHMWPGSEAHIGGVDLAFVDKYNGDELLNNKVKRVLGWLDLPGPKSPEMSNQAPRPQLLVTYVPNVDSDGHLYGPNSTEIRDTIQQADNMLKQLFDGIKARNLTDIVNVIVVSDHGMATTSIDRLIQLDDIVDIGKIQHTDGWPLYGLRPYNDEDIDPIYEDLKAKSQGESHFEVYHRDKDMPEEYHFSKNPRIAPIWIVPETGWAIVKKEEFNVKLGKDQGLVYHPRGLHGYDYRHPLMRAIFVARGPAFPHEPHSRVEEFQNLNVYNIICDSIGVEPKPNSGTLRLPFTTTGKHDDADAPVRDDPEDLPPPPASTITQILPEATPAQSGAAASGTAVTMIGYDDDPFDDDERIKFHEGTGKSLWGWIQDGFNNLLDGIKHIFGGKDTNDDDD